MKKIILNIILVFAVTNTLAAQEDIPERPQPPRLVNDFAGILTEPQKRHLESKLVAFDDSTGTQIAVVTVNDLAGYEKAEFTFTLMTNWGVGRAGKDNGVVVMIKPTGGEGQRQAFIAPGYGLEGVIPDAIAKRIVENEMIPEFRGGNYFEGIDRATSILMGLASQEFTAADYEKKTGTSPVVSILPLLFFFILFIIFSTARRKNKTLGHSTSIWTLLWLLGSSGRGHSGNWGKFSGGGGSFGGGGFGGFGGGRSGGGGAGGSW